MAGALLRVRIGPYNFAPSGFITLVFVVLLSLLLALGTWQMRRAAEKTDMLSAASSSASETPVAISELNDVELAASQYTRVALSGQYDSERQFLWDNRVFNGQAGFEVITPVSTEDGTVLVNRGWVAPGKTRQDLPNVDVPANLIGTSVNVEGLFSRPSKGLVSGEAFEKTASWPLVLQFFDYEAMESALGVELVRGVIQPQVKEAEPVTRSGRIDFYTANWEPAAAIGPARHYSYAFQWYALAFALCVLFVVHNTKRIES